MSATPDNHPSPGARAIVWLCKRILWIWPMVPATRIGGAIVARPVRAVLAAAPVFLVVVAAVLARWGVQHQRWGQDVATAWRNEQVARKNVEITENFLREHARDKPSRVYEWQKRTMGSAGYEQHQKERLAWEEIETRAQQIRTGNRAGIPSVFSPRAPEQSFPSAAWAWEILYGVDHVLFGTIYLPVVLFYLVLGILQAWRGADRRSPRRWRRSLSQQNKDRLLLGLDDRGQAYFLPEAQRSQHLLVTGASGFGKTQALILRISVHGDHLDRSMAIT